jgi:hypothetical protein
MTCPPCRPLPLSTLVGRSWGTAACAVAPASRGLTNTRARKHGQDPTLLAMSRRAISNTMGVSFSRGMYWVSLAFKRRV